MFKLFRTTLVSSLSVLLLVFTVAPFQNVYAQSGAEEVEDFAPLVMDRRDGARVFVADTRMDIDDIGTLEIAITIPDYPGDFFPQVMTLASHEDGAAIAFRAQIGGRGTKIGLYTGGIGQILDYDFRKGGFFHIAFAFREGQTTVTVNDQDIGVMQTGIGLGRAMPLYVGGQPTELETFSGDIHYIRLWDLDLTRADLRQTKGFFGQPTGLGGLDARLVLYSEFTNQREEVLFTKPVDPSDLVGTGQFGIEEGEPFSLLIPEGHEIVSIGTTTQGGDLLSFSFKTLGPDGASVRRSVNSSRAGETPAPVCDAQGNCTMQLPPSFSEFNRDPEKGLRVRGLGGTVQNSGGPLSGLVVVFEDGSLNLLTPTANGTSAGRVQLPDNLIFAGFAGTVGETISSIGVLADVPVPAADLSGRWTMNGTQPPVKMPAQAARANGGNALHGNYTRQPVFTFEARNGGRIVAMHRERGLPQTFRLSTDGAVWTSNNGAKLEVMDQDTILIDGFPMTRVPDYPAIKAKDHSFNEFGGTFNMEHQIPFTEHMFMGYDIGLIDPENLQDPTPLRLNVFQAPTPDSLDFFVSYRKIVPYGLLHFPDIREKSRKDSQGMSSAQDYTSSMSTSVGFSIGVPKVASFGINASVREKMENQSSSKSQFAVTRDVRTQRALVVDDRHMRLDPYFRSRILDMARDIKAGRDPNVGIMINEFGTHYSHAMTIGTISVDVLHFSNTAFREMYEKGTSIGVKADATVKKVKVGGSYEHDKGFSDSFNKEMEQQTEDINGVGSETLPVPVFLDLRKLDTLLATPYFDDPVITGTLRTLLSREITTYVASFPSNRQRPEDIWEPYFFSLGIESATAGRIPTFDNGEEVVSVDVEEFYGDLIVADPLTLKHNVVTRILKGQARDASRVFRPGPVAAQTVMITASEICGIGVPQPALLAAGGNYTLIIDDAESRKVALSIFNPLALTGATTTQVFQVRYGSGAPAALDVTAFAKRLPDLDGGFKEMPICP